jgi:hypothetical protein
MQLILSQDNVDKEVFFKKKHVSSEYANRVYYLRDEEIIGLKALLDRQEELAIDAVHRYVKGCKSEKKFKVWPGQADDLLASHRDALGSWVTEVFPLGKWDVHKPATTSEGGDRHKFSRSAGIPTAGLQLTCTFVPCQRQIVLSRRFSCGHDESSC